MIVIRTAELARIRPVACLIGLSGRLIHDLFALQGFFLFGIPNKAVEARYWKALPLGKFSLVSLLVLLATVTISTIGSAQVSRNSQRPVADLQFRSIRLGGYVDLELFHDSNRFEFKNHRLVPMIDATVSESVHFACEIEIEYGGPQVASGDGEIKVEYAHVDVEMGDWKFRSGAILVPLGATNLYHDSPMRDLTNRPLVARTIVPSTLTSAGVGGLWGADDGSWSLQVYALNGFNGEDGTGGYNFDSSSGVRSAAPSLKFNGDRSPSLCGRMTYSPVLGTEFGFSTWNGPWDQAGDLDLTITVFDLTTDLSLVVEALGPVELQIEVGEVDIEIDESAEVGGVPERLVASSVQISRRFFPAAIENLFGDESSCGLTLRLEQEDLSADVKNRSTIGFNIRPTEETVLKFDFERERIENQQDPDGTFIFSVATYF